MKNEKKKVNILSIISIISIFIAVITLLVLPVSMAITACTIAIVLSIIGIICGLVSRKQIKNTGEKGEGLSLASIIIGFVVIVFSGLDIAFFLAMQDLEFSDAVLCPEATYCVNNNDGTSTCKNVLDLDISCTTEHLKPQQFK